MQSPTICPISMASDSPKHCEEHCRFNQNGKCLLEKVAEELVKKEKSKA